MRELFPAFRQAAALWCLFASAAAFALMGVDKRRARRGAWRVPEAVLWAFALLGGAVGGALGMRRFRHKTRRRRFRYGFPLLAALEMGALAWLWWPCRLP